MARISFAARSARPPVKSRISPVAGIDQQRVDGEIAAQRVLSRIGLEVHGNRMAAVEVPEIAAEGGDFHVRAALMHQHDSEMRAHLVGGGKKPQQFFGLRGGRHVEILRYSAQQQVADTPSDQVGRMAGLPQIARRWLPPDAMIHSSMLI